MLKPAISADSHIVEPPNCYVDFIDPKYRDRAPHIEKNKHGVDVFVIEGMKHGLPLGLLAGAGIPPDQLRAQRNASFVDLARGSWDPKARIAIQDEEDICGEIIYASVGMVMCSHPDFDYKSACFQAYNRWLQGFCGELPNRLFGLAQTAVASVDSAIADFKRAKEMGMVGMMMTGNPQHEDYDHRDYDALWECAVDLDLPICFHILTSSDHGVETAFKAERGHAANGFMNIIRGVQNVMGVFLFGGVFERHPKLKMVVAEGDAGWVPHYMYRADHAAERLGTGLDRFISKKPSEYVRNNVWFTFQDDATAYQTEVLVGDKALVDGHNLIWASDYPHTDSTYPRSRQVRETQMAKLNEFQKNNILHDNVRNLFNLPVQ
ncbi:MAG: amidohydrolase family protein [Porticoccaceae bacterium]